MIFLSYSLPVLCAHNPHFAPSFFAFPRVYRDSHTLPRGFPTHTLLLHLFLIFQTPADYLLYKSFPSEDDFHIENNPSHSSPSQSNPIQTIRPNFPDIYLILCLHFHFIIKRHLLSNLCVQILYSMRAVFCLVILQNSAWLSRRHPLQKTPGLVMLRYGLI